MSFAEAVRSALEVSNPHESQAQVQETVAKRLAELSPRSEVRRTGYFNHSWAPDLVLRSRGAPEERRVFFRFDVRDPSFEDDLHYLADGGPLFLDLKAANSSVTERRSDHRIDVAEALSGKARGDVLVTELPAVDRFESGVHEDQDVRTATQQVIVGGHGLVDPPAADQIVSYWRSAASAAVEAEGVALRTALDKVESYLSRVSAMDLETSLRSRWVAAGEPAETFPGREDWRLDDRPPWEIAELVLALVDQDSSVESERWQEIARAISASALGHELRAADSREGGKVDELVRAGLDLWTAQYAYVPPLDSDSFERFHWSFGRYALAINLIRRKAFFTEISSKWNTVPKTPVLPEARARQDLLTDSAVLGVGLVTTEENLSMQLRPSATETLGRRLEKYIGGEEGPGWRTSRIRRLELRVPGTETDAHVDYERSVVRTDNPIPLRTFVLLVAKFVAGLDEDEMAELEGSLGLN